MAISRGVHRADEGRPHLRLSVEEEVAGPVGQAALRDQGPSAAGGRKTLASGNKKGDYWS